MSKMLSWRGFIKGLLNVQKEVLNISGNYAMPLMDYSIKALHFMRVQKIDHIHRRRQ
jgi:hypothetical protein